MKMKLALTEHTDVRSRRSGGAGFQSPRSGTLSRGDHGGWQRVSADRAAERTRRRGRVHVVHPLHRSASAGAVHSPGTGPVGECGSGFIGHSVEVDVIVGKRAAGRLGLSPLGEVELQVDGYLTTQKQTGY